MNVHPEHLTCPARTLDNVAKKVNVVHIDLLKIDVEGAEHMVLAEAESFFVNRSIRIVRFEYGQININTRFLLQDFYAFFKGAGFREGKVFPNTLDFSDYSLGMGNFIGPNFLAVTEAEPELIQALS